MSGDALGVAEAVTGEEITAAEGVLRHDARRGLHITCRVTAGTAWTWRGPPGLRRVQPSPSTAVILHSHHPTPHTFNR